MVRHAAGLERATTEALTTDERTIAVQSSAAVTPAKRAMHAANNWEPDLPQQQRRHHDHQQAAPPEEQERKMAHPTTCWITPVNTVLSHVMDGLDVVIISNGVYLAKC